MLLVVVTSLPRLGGKGCGYVLVLSGMNRHPWYKFPSPCNSCWSHCFHVCTFPTCLPYNSQSNLHKMSHFFPHGWKPLITSQSTQKEILIPYFSPISLDPSCHTRCILLFSTLWPLHLFSPLRETLFPSVLLWFPYGCFLCIKIGLYVTGPL